MIATLFLAFAAVPAIFVHALDATAQNDIRVLIYESDALLNEEHHTKMLLKQINKVNGLTATLFGQGHFDGFGGKFKALIPILDEIPDDDLVVVSDSRDVLINNPKESSIYSQSAVDEFHENFEILTHNYPGAIVISAEAQCCVAALSHVSPGAYFKPDGTRAARACSSGEPDCLWKGDDKGLAWQSFMKDIANDRTGGQGVDDVYLNAGLIAGRAGDLLRVLNALQLGEREDDQAVLSDFMYHNPASIILDYGQTMFGNNRGGIADVDGGGCVFVQPKLASVGHSRLIHTHTLSSPLFLHSPGGFFECYEALAAALGYDVVHIEKHRRLLAKDSERELKPGGNYRNRRQLTGHGSRKLMENREEKLEEVRAQLRELLLGGSRRRLNQPKNI